MNIEDPQALTMCPECNAIDTYCPTCGGTGTITNEAFELWEANPCACEHCQAAGTCLGCDSGVCP